MEPNYGWPREETQEVMAKRWRKIGSRAGRIEIGCIGSDNVAEFYAAPMERIGVRSEATYILRTSQE